MLIRFFLPLLAVVSFASAFGNDLAEENRQKIISLQRMVMEQRERIDGLTSLMEGFSATLAQMRSSQKRYAGQEEQNSTRKLLEDLGKMIDEINEKYVSRAELTRLISSKGVGGSERPVKAQADSAKKRTPAELYSEGVRLFVKKRYDEAKERFLTTAKKGYKPAASNYYLGEIAYYTHQYKDAVFYYKKSAGLYDKAGYMDVLLLHTAISLDKSGEREEAKYFYETIIENYPGKKSAAIAKKRVRRL